AVGQVAHLLEVGEDDPARLRDQRGHDAEPRLLVEDALQSVVGEPACRLARSVFGLKHDYTPGSGKERAPPRAGPRRTERPSTREKAPPRHAPRPAQRAPSPGRTPPPRTSAWAAAGTRRKSPARRRSARGPAGSKRHRAQTARAPSSRALRPGA